MICTLVGFATLVTVMLLNVVGEVPLIVCAEEPFNNNEPAFELNVPLFVKFPATLSVEEDVSAPLIVIPLN